MENRTLRIQLSQFGLNPKDWQLHRVRKGRYLITGNEDAGFRLYGVTDEQHPKKWKWITWITV